MFNTSVSLLNPPSAIQDLYEQISNNSSNFELTLDAVKTVLNILCKQYECNVVPIILTIVTMYLLIRDFHILYEDGDFDWRRIYVADIMFIWWLIPVALRSLDSVTAVNTYENYNRIAYSS